MNFLKYCATPMKLFTLVALIGLGHFMMASILVGLVLISQSPTTSQDRPRNAWRTHTSYLPMVYSLGESLGLAANVRDRPPIYC
jgi:hypothetical protein